MDKLEFLESPSVREFIKWLGFKLDNPKSFMHSYRMKRGDKAWSCDSIYSSYERYEWPYRCTDPVTGRRLIGKTFEENQTTLCGLSNGLRHGVQENDSERTQRHCLSILEWGGVLPKNQGKILDLGNDLPKYLDNVRHRLDPTEFDTNNNCADIIMNSGFTKIYSLLIDEFIIYDGRVGAALGLLVRTYCEENNLPTVPPKLLFAYGNARTATYQPLNRRNPGTERYRFPVLSTSSPKHIENNLRANWLLKEVLETCNSKFNVLHSSIQLRALESALFMIGYEVVSAG